MLIESVNPRSKSLIGLVTGSSFAWRSASSNRRDSASPARLFRLDRLLEQRVAPPRLVREDARRFVQLGLVAALRRVVRDDATQVGVDDEQRVAAGTLQLDLALQLRHGDYSIDEFTN